MNKYDKKSLASFLIVLGLLIISIVVYFLYFIVYRQFPSVSSNEGWPLFLGLGFVLEGFMTIVLILKAVSFIKYINVYKVNTNKILRTILSILTIILTLMTIAFLRMMLWDNLLVFPVISLVINLVSYIVINFISPISFLREVHVDNPSKLEQIENL